VPTNCTHWSAWGQDIPNRARGLDPQNSNGIEFVVSRLSGPQHSGRVLSDAVSPCGGESASRMDSILARSFSPSCISFSSFFFSSGSLSMGTSACRRGTRLGEAAAVGARALRGICFALVLADD
jgi:hypothetical protein